MIVIEGRAAAVWKVRLARCEDTAVCTFPGSHRWTRIYLETA